MKNNIKIIFYYYLLCSSVFKNVVLQCLIILSEKLTIIIHLTINLIYLMSRCEMECKAYQRNNNKNIQLMQNLSYIKKLLIYIM